jgi:hypothetical protein
MDFLSLVVMGEEKTKLEESKELEEEAKKDYILLG